MKINTTVHIYVQAKQGIPAEAFAPSWKWKCHLWHFPASSSSRFRLTSFSH